MPSPRARANAFDRSRPVDVRLVVLIGPSVLDNADDNLIEYVAELAAFEGIEIWALSTDPDRRRELAERDVQTGFIREDDSYYSFHTPGRSHLLPTSGHVQLRYREHAAGSLNWWQEQVILDFDDGVDLVVGDPTAIAAMRKSPRSDDYVTLSEAEQRIRLFLVSRERPQILPRYFVNEGFYFLIRVRMMCPELAKAYVRLQTARDTEASGDIATQLQSLLTRLEFLLEATDRTLIECLKSPNNDTESRALYHLSYQLVLAAAVLEDLAWLLAFHYGLALRRMSVTLRRTARGWSDLVKTLESTAPMVFSVLVDVDAQEFLFGIFEIRDQIQHRDHPQPIGHEIHGVGRARGHIELPRDPVVAVGKWAGVPIRVFEGLPGRTSALIDPYTLALGVQRGMAKMVNSLLSAIPWSQKFVTLESEQRATVIASHDRWNQDPETVFDLPRLCRLHQP